jgi:phage baseplate assembly protein gpV/phage protein D
MSAQVQNVPSPVVEVNGRELSLRERRALWELRVQQRLSLPTLCELTFVEPAAEVADPGIKVGASLSVRLENTSTPLFSGEVTAIERIYEPSRGREVRVRGYDRLHRLRKRQSVRTHLQVRLQELIKELVADLNIQVEAVDSGPLWPRVVQFSQTDFQLISDLASDSGLHFWLGPDSLRVFTLDGVGSEVPLTLGESLFEARIEMNGESVCRSVSTTAWDPLRVEAHNGSTEVARSGRQIGVELKPESLGAGERILVDETLATDSQAEALAQAELDLSVAQQVTFWGVAEGNPELCPGRPIRVERVSPEFAGRYVLTSVDHSIDSVRGFVSIISSALPERMVSQRSALAALGIVVHVDDPEGFGRVQVTLPTYNNIETDWLEVLTPGAGLGKGLLALPDVNDTVLVLFPRGDPAQGIVMGGLYGMWTRDEWDWGVESSAVKRYTLRTPGGQRVLLDDAKQITRIENSDGSYVQMTPDKVTIHARRDLEIEAPGRNLVLRARKIDFQQQ